MHPGCKDPKIPVEFNIELNIVFMTTNEHAFEQMNMRLYLGLLGKSWPKPR